MCRIWVGNHFPFAHLPAREKKSVLNSRCLLPGIYSSSKRCLELLADTLRLELSPFNVSVLSIVTGAIQTNGHSSAFHEWNLPPRSLYRSIEESIARRARGQDDGIERMDPMAYARKVVGEIVARGGARGKGKGKFWYGNLASQMWFASTFLPAAIVVS